MKFTPLILLLLGFLAYRCSNEADIPLRKVGQETKNTSGLSSSEDDSANESEQKTVKSDEKSTELKHAEDENISTLELLQGKWQSLDDKKNFLVFDKNNRKEIGEGMTSYDVESFILSDRCSNDSDKDASNPNEKDKYITCPESDMCWYIVNLDKSTLSLSYIGRGNTLNYKKVK